VTGTQVNTSQAVLERVPDAPGALKQELHACQVELISEVCTSVAEAMSQMSGMRHAVRATGVGILGAGTHPSAAEGSAEITDQERYERIRHLLGDAVVTPVAGLHVHVGVPDADTAVRTFNGLREHLPLLAALAANSPFRHGRRTNLASAREVTLRSWPRSGVPRALGDFAEFERLAELLSRAAGVADYTWFWWKLRPHPKLGTVEIRALDAQTTVEDMAALVALAHCLARHAAESDPGLSSPPEVIEEGLFRAARFGTTAQLPDAEGRLHDVSDLLDEALQTAGGRAAELGCAEELATVPELLRRGGGAGHQRAVYEVAGMDALLRDLSVKTGGPPG
jgi:carboxylate-amine ligase